MPVVRRSVSSLVRWVAGVALAIALAGPPVRADRPEDRVRAVEARVGPGFIVDVEGPFVVAGDLTRAEFERFCRGTIRWAYEHLRAEFFVHVPFKRTITIYLFAGDRSYRDNALRLFGERPSTPFGYFSDRHDALVMNIATGGGTLVHELVHPLLDNDFPGVPSWFNEGLASLFEQCSERDGRMVGLTNWRLAGLQEELEKDGSPVLESLVATSSRTFYGERSGFHYAAARYLLYWLQEKGLLRDFYARYNRARQSDPTGRKTLESILGVRSLGEAEPAWRAFVASLRFVR